MDCSGRSGKEGRYSQVVVRDLGGLGGDRETGVGCGAAVPRWSRGGGGQ